MLALRYPSSLWRSAPDFSADTLSVTANDCIALPHAYNPHSNRPHGGLVQRGLSAAIAAAAGFSVCAAADKRFSLSGMFKVQFTPDAKMLVGKMLSESMLSRPGIMIHRQGPVAENSRAPSGQTNWKIERPHPWNVRLGDFEMIRDNDEDVVVVEGMRVWLALIPKPGEAGVEVSVCNGQLYVDAIAA